MNAKIRSAQLMKVPYMPVVGDQEAANGTVSLRKRDGSRQDGMAVDQFVGAWWWSASRRAPASCKPRRDGEGTA